MDRYSLPNIRNLEICVNFVTIERTVQAYNLKHGENFCRYINVA